MPDIPSAHILVAEDDATTLDAIQKLLVGVGYRVTVARGGAAAFRAYTADHPDLLVTDLNMAGGDGYTLIERVRGLAATPVIVITGANTAYARQRVEADFQGVSFLTKPFVRQRFLDLIDRLLHGDDACPRSARGELVG
jgi:CheY-like chemotaxis protein